MGPQTKATLGTLGRLTAAGGAAWLSAHFTGDANLGVALGSVFASYLTNRANLVEQASAEELRGSRNHHLQIALAGAFRLALDNIQPRHPEHRAIFEAWQSILEHALDGPATLLPIVIPAQFDPLLDAANPYLDTIQQGDAFTEAEQLLRFWLAYHQAFEETGAWPMVAHSRLPDLPADLHNALEKEFLPEFQNAFANLLNRSELASRAFVRRQLQEIRAVQTQHTAVLGDIDAKTRLRLEPLRPPASLTTESELDILRAENRVIPVVGRERDLASLRAWLATPAPVSIRVLTGPAGAGKTRLAIQLIEELAGSDWHAGFLRDPELAKAPDRDWRQPTLAVVDYAAASAQLLKTWLGYLADPPHRLRVLLLEREADPKSGWLNFLLDRMHTGTLIASRLEPPLPVRITPLVTVDLRRQVLERTLQALGTKSALPAPGQDPLFELRLAESLWQDPLYLMMAALVARQTGGLAQALALRRTDLAFRLADRELDRIARFMPADAAPESSQLLVRLAAIVTACRSLEFLELIAIAKEESEAMGIEFKGGPRIPATRVADALTRQGKIAAIEPDIVGEAVMLRAFGGSNLGEGTPALLRAASRANRRHAPSVCFAITRTCQDFAGEECPDPLDWVEELIRSGESDDPLLLLELEAQMPHDTLILRERAARIDGLLLSRYRQSEASEETNEVLARLANNLALRLSDLGRREEALAQAEEAVRTYRQLAHQRPDAFLHDLATSLQNLATLLSALGRREEALAEAEDAVRIRRQLTQQRPAGEQNDAFLPGLATSLHNLATCLSALGRREEALVQSEEALRIRRQLAQQRPDAFLPDLAISLNNLATTLSDLGRREEALAQAGEALRIYRQLAQQRPDAFLPDLAMSLNNLANRLSDLGRREEALAQSEEAVRIRRQLAQQRPDVFLPGLAMSLHNLAIMLNALGRREEAMAQAEEAVRIYRQLAQQRPDAFLPNFATSLNNLATMLSGLGRPEEALAQAEEAVRIYRQLAQRRPDAFLPDLAMSLHNLATTLSALGRHEEALAQSEETLRIRRQMAQQRPDVFLPDLATSLNNLATTLSALGRRKEALAQAEESVRIYRQLAQQRPDVFLPDLSRSLAVRGRVLGDERAAEAIASYEEAVVLLTPLYLALPQAHGPLMAAIVRLYLNTAKSAGATPDEKLLAPLANLLGGE